MSEAALKQELIPSETIKKRRPRDKEKVRLYMGPYMTRYRADEKIAYPLGLTVAQWRKQQREAVTAK